MEKHGYGDLKMSYIQTPSAVFDLPRTISDRIRELAKANPDKMAFVFRQAGQPRDTLTRKQVADKSDWLARHFVRHGIRAGDKVAILVDTPTNWTITYFGINMTGGTVINSPSFDEKEFTKIAKGIGCVATVTELKQSKGDLSKAHHRSVILTTFQDHKDKITTFDLFGLTEDNQVPDVDLPEVHADDEAMMVLTSGSSGMPKLVVHTHASILAGVYSMGDFCELEEDTIVANDRPMSWIGGQPILYLGIGLTTVYIKAKVNSDSDDEFFVNVLSSERPDAALLMEYRLNSLQRRPDLLDRMPFLSTSIAAGQRVATGLGFELGTAGYPCSGCEVRVVDEKGEVVCVKTQGELCLRGPACAKAYVYLDGSRVPIVDEDGWYHTGDVALIHQDGRIVIIGRKTEMLKRASVKIFPSFVERKIQENFEEIEEVVVVGVDDDILHQEVCACITLTPDTRITTEDIKRRAEDIFSPSLAPDGLGYMPGHFLLMDSFPKTTSGKCDRLSLTKMAEEIIKGKTQKS
ncbi:salicylyl-CoA synthase / salicylate adenylyltransferase-like [Liolophura sinensis]|uniref:salicylyl-CoA synthase / salicylate adenylyltransferase-like n=1 Tax=Liolophura sinensis TaxID=3198878 RepID=UPI003158B3F8